jgi:DNA-binding transcriptional LysR family regulator
MRQFTLRQLECFVAVAEERSITAAARRLNLTPGAVSVAIRELETSLGTGLTTRRRGEGTAVTPAGRAAWERARTILAEADALHAAANSARGTLAGPLRLGCFTTVSPWLIPPIVAHFDREFPSVDIQFAEGPTAVLAERLRADELDAVLSYANHLGSSLTAHPLVSARLEVAVAADHRLSKLDAVPLRELRDERAILLALEPAISHVEHYLRRAGISPNIAWRSENIETVRGMVARGLGYTIMMGRPYGDRSYDGLALEYRPITDALEPNALVLAVREHDTLNAKLEHLVEFCRGEFADRGYFGWG